MTAHEHDHAGAPRRHLAAALAIIAGVAVVQVIGAVATGSLALLADSGHMLSDSIGLVVALIATTVAARPATDRATYGFRRAEVLGALVNGLLLLGIAIGVGVEAVRRLLAAAGAEVLAGPMLVVALLGLAANVAALLVLRGGRGDSINMRGAYLEVLGDLLGSVAAIAAAVVILATGFAPADAIASLVVAGLILPRALVLLRDVVRVLDQSAPPGVRVAEIREHVLRTPGVVDVHDVHVWAITQGAPVFTAHVVVADSVLADGGADALLDELAGCLEAHFDVAHSTFQLEPASHAAHEPEAARHR